MRQWKDYNQNQYKINIIVPFQGMELLLQELSILRGIESIDSLGVQDLHPMSALDWIFSQTPQHWDPRKVDWKHSGLVGSSRIVELNMI